MKKVTPGEWFTASVCIERTTQSSSAIPPMCGSSSLTSMPEPPERRNGRIAGSAGQRA